MKIWKVSFATDEYDYLVAEEDWEIDKIRTFDGRRHSEGWEPVRVTNLEPEKGLDFGNGVKFYSSLPAFDSKAKSCLEDLCLSSVEFLPLINDKRDFWAVNIIAVLDCIDYEKAEYKKFSDGKRIMYFKKYAFDVEKVRDVHFFKIKDMPLAGFFASDTFKNVVEENNLTGFKFELVWDSEKE